MSQLLLWSNAKIITTAEQQYTSSFTHIMQQDR